MSSLYALGPSPAITRDERTLRNREAVRRVLMTHGADAVLARVLEMPPSDTRSDLLRMVEVQAAREWLRPVRLKDTRIAAGARFVTAEFDLR